MLCYVMPICSRPRVADRVAAPSSLGGASPREPRRHAGHAGRVGRSRQRLDGEVNWMVHPSPATASPPVFAWQESLSLGLARLMAALAAPGLWWRTAGDFRRVPRSAAATRSCTILFSMRARYSKYVLF